MTLRNSARHYGSVARTLHWLMAALLLWQFSLALTMVQFEGDWYYRLTSWHEWTGVTLLTLVTVRLIWRLVDPPPPLDAPPLLRFGAHAVHAGLYALLFAIPATGYMMTNALGFPVVLYGLIPLPTVLAPNRALGFQLLALHFWLGMTLAGLFCLHAGAALLHHFVLRDGTLKRMLPRRSGDSA